MEIEVKEKLEPSKMKKRSGTTLTLRKIPKRVHDALKTYQNRISADRGKKFTIKEAYVEFLKEVVK